MTQYTVGHRIGAADLRRRAFPLVGLVETDFVIISSTTMVGVAGLLVPLEASRHYAVDGYVAYSANSTMDAKFTIETSARGFADGFWGVHGTDAAAASNPGVFNASPNVEGFEGDLPFFLAGDTEPLAARISAYVDTGPYVPLTIQVKAAQSTSTASALTVKAGSWIRATEIA